MEHVMDAIDIVDARARLSELVDRVEAGESIEIARCGEAVARLVPIRRPVDVARLRALTVSLPPQPDGAADRVRRMRDGDRF